MTAEPNEADLRAAQPSVLVKIVSVALGIAGLLAALSGLQVIGVRWRDPMMGALSMTILIAGALQVVMAFQYFRARPWAAFTGAALAAVLALLMAAWLFLTFPGMLSCMVVVAVPATAIAAILSLVGIGSVRATARARQRLADDGMSLGL